MPIKKERERENMFKKLLKLNYDLAFLLYQTRKSMQITRRRISKYFRYWCVIDCVHFGWYRLVISDERLNRLLAHTLPEVKLYL